MRVLRTVLTILYASYLVNAGVLLIMLPWSEAWTRFILLVPMRWAVIADSPAVRGAISAFGALHLLLLAAEFLQPSLWNHGRRRDLM